MKKILSTILIAFITIITVNAQSAGTLTVTMKNGKLYSYSLANTPQLSFGNNKVNISVNGKIYSYNQDDLDSLYVNNLSGHKPILAVKKNNTSNANIMQLLNGTSMRLIDAPKEILIDASDLNNIDITDMQDNGNGAYTKTCLYTPYKLDTYSMLDVQPSSTSSQPYIAFKLPWMPNNVTYDLYLVTIPLRMGYHQGLNINDADTLKPYQFRINMFYRTNKSTDAIHLMPTTKSETLKNPENPSSQNFVSDVDKIDTFYLGTKTFYEQLIEPSGLLQIQAYVSSSQSKTYSRRMLISSIIARQTEDSNPTKEYLKIGDEIISPKDSIETITIYDNTDISAEILSNEMTDTRIRVNSNFYGQGGNVEFMIGNDTTKYVTLNDYQDSHVISVPFLLFPDYEYKIRPVVGKCKGEWTTFKVNSPKKQLFSIEMAENNISYTFTTKIYGLKTFVEDNIKSNPDVIYNSVQQSKIDNTYPFNIYTIGIQIYDSDTKVCTSHIGMRDLHLSTDNLTSDTLTYTSTIDKYLLKDRNLEFNKKYYCVPIISREWDLNYYSYFYETQKYTESKKCEFATISSEDCDKLMHSIELPGAMAEDNTISLFNKALSLTHFCDSLYKYRDDNYHCSVDSFEEGHTYYTATEYDNVFYMEKRYYGFTGFIEPDSVYAKHGIFTIDDLKAYAKNIYDDMYPEDANVTDPTDRRNSLNRFVSYHFLDRLAEYNKLTVDNKMLTSNFDRRHWDVADWYETMMPHSIIKVSYPSGSQAGRYLNRRGVQDHADERGIFVAGSKIMSPSESGKELKALNGVYHYINNIIDYGRQTQEIVLNERIRVDATTLSPDFMTSGARGHSVTGTGGCPDYPGQYGVWSSDPNPKTNINTCLGFKSGSAKNFMFNDAQTHLHVRPRYLSFWCYQGDEVTICGKYDVTVKLPPLPEGEYELRLQNCLGFSNRGIVQYYLDGKACGIPRDIRGSGTDSDIGWRSDNDLGSDEAILAYDIAMHNRGWMKGPASYGSTATDGSGTRNPMRNTANQLRQIICTFRSDGKTDHYLRMKQMLDSTNGTMAFDYIELCPKSVYDNELYPEDKW